MIPTNKEEDIFLARLKDKILNLIEKEFEKAGIDRTFYPVYLKIDTLGVDFNKVGEVILINEVENFCCFCGKKTQYYDNRLYCYLCADCFKKLFKEELK